MRENNFTELPMALYGVILWMAGLAFYMLVRTMIASHGKDSTIATAIGRDAKGLACLAGYTVAIALAFINLMVSFALYVVIALIWFIPDTRIEKTISR